MPAQANQSAARREERSGLIAGVAAFGTWGLIPVYWKLLSALPAYEILAHRFVWTTAFLTGLLSWQRRWSEVREATQSRRALFYCLASGLAISVNWFFFIWAVNVGRVVETSLGYFMTPLVNVLFGAVFLRERLTRWQFLSVMLALVGVLNLTFGYGRFPWLAITLCVSFGLYGLLRKKSGVRPIPGLFLETSLLTPVGIGYLAWLQARGGGTSALSSASWSLTVLLISTGVVTGLPLVWFGHAAR
ncbi:MAG TPA: EamA family transporter RarD, partial [Chthoniobacterales bacterium]|nr:EamA family transporter RarD [Chthoniobacterales bacterium]